MKVYVVMSGFYEQYRLSGLFSSRERAQQYIDGEKAAAEPWMDCAKNDYFEIHEEEVDSLLEVHHAQIP